jgi:hypothetical protein
MESSAATGGRQVARPIRIVAPLLSSAATGCAHSSDEIDAQHVSPIQYAHYDCQQIPAEEQRVSARVGQLAGEVDDIATGDTVATTVGVILFWPALFFIDGDGPEANEYARLKGGHEALQKASIEKECGIAPAATTTSTTS